MIDELARRRGTRTPPARLTAPEDRADATAPNGGWSTPSVGGRVATFPIAKVVPMQWSTALAGFEGHQRAQNRAARTIEGRRQMLLALARATGKDPDQITHTDLLARMGRGIAASSMQRERSDLQTFFGWAKANKLIRKNPAKDLPKVSVPRGRPRPFTVEQVESMLTSGAYRRTRIMIMLGVYQGFRAHEIAKFRGDDIDYSSGTIIVTGKGGYEDAVPLHPVVAAIAPSMPSGYWFPARGGRQGAISYRSVSDLMTNAIRRAGITDRNLTGHALRHTFGTELSEAGVDIRVVQELMRHRSLNSTQIYTRVSDRRKREGLASLPVVTLPVRSGRLAPAA